MGNSKINNSANFSMICGSGVYVRSIARDLGIALNCFGHITKLRRTMVGDFRENESVTIEQLTKKNTTTYSPMSCQSGMALLHSTLSSDGLRQIYVMISNLAIPISVNLLSK